MVSSVVLEGSLSLFIKPSYKHYHIVLTRRALRPYLSKVSPYYAISHKLPPFPQKWRPVPIRNQYPTRSHGGVTLGDVELPF